MSKKKNDEKKEELLNALKELSEKDEVPEEMKEKLKEISVELNDMKIYSKSSFVFAYIFIYLMKLIITYNISLTLIGLFSGMLVIENKLFIFLIPLGVSLLFSSLSFAISLISNTKSRISFGIYKLLFVIMIFVMLNMMYPIFEFNTVWIFYLSLTYIVNEYLIYLILRSKIWNEK